MGSAAAGFPSAGGWTAAAFGVGASVEAGVTAGSWRYVGALIGGNVGAAANGDVAGGSLRLAPGGEAGFVAALFAMGAADFCGTSAAGGWTAGVATGSVWGGFDVVRSGLALAATSNGDCGIRVRSVSSDLAGVASGRWYERIAASGWAADVSTGVSADTV